MKRIGIIICLFTLFISVANAQGTVVEEKPGGTISPMVESQNRSDFNIEAVVLLPDTTKIGFFLGRTFAILGGWLEISPNTYIEYINPQSGVVERVKIIGMKGFDENDTYKDLPLGKKHYNLVATSLLFPAIPRGVSKINLIEDVKKGWRFYGIHINPRDDVDVPRVAFTESKINNLIDSSSLYNAGIYEVLSSPENKITYKLALINYEDKIMLVYLGQYDNKGSYWKYGEVKAVLRQTSVSDFYKAEWYTAKKRKTSAVISLEGNVMSIKIEGSEADLYVRMGESNKNENNKTINKWSGTGYAIDNYFVVTNNHVVDNAENIIVKGVNGDFNTEYPAEVVITDKTNDLAIIKIKDTDFKGFGAIPYAVQQRMAEVGEDVFVLGYPLTQALGNEIKLTNGIISSRTGYQGDIATYQMSAPVQPGNSGGPLFDSKGNVIGIVVSGIPGAENVGYAIKTTYLKLLIESAGLNIRLPSNNTVSTLSLADKVKKVKNYVYYIECR